MVFQKDIIVKKQNHISIYFMLCSFWIFANNKIEENLNLSTFGFTNKETEKNSSLPSSQLYPAFVKCNHRPQIVIVKRLPQKPFYAKTGKGQLLI